MYRLRSRGILRTCYFALLLLSGLFIYQVVAYAQHSPLAEFENTEGKKILFICSAFSSDYITYDRSTLHEVLDTVPCRNDRVFLVFVPYGDEDCVPCSTAAAEFGALCRCYSREVRSGIGLKSAPSWKLFPPDASFPISFPSSWGADLAAIPVGLLGPPSGDFSIKPVEWLGAKDDDEDGFYSGDLRLSWDADVGDGQTRDVIAHVEWRSSTAPSWQKLDSIGPYRITGSQSSDAVSAVVRPPVQGHYDFRINLLQCGSPSVIDSRTPDDDEKLRRRPLESQPEDEPPLPCTIRDARWSDVIDADSDGFLRSGSRLIWDADIRDDLSHAVKAHVCFRRTNDTGWTRIDSTQCYMVRGVSARDSASTVVSANVRGTYDFKVEIVECGDTVVVAEYGPDHDPDLSAISLESVEEDLPERQFLIRDVHWSGVRDLDKDGFMSCNARLSWNADVNRDRGHSVVGKVYARRHGSVEWEVVYETRPYEVRGSTDRDTMSVSTCTLDRGSYEFRIHLFEAAGGTFVASYTPADDSDLRDVKIEPDSADVPPITYSIRDVAWSGASDKDGDGYVREGAYLLIDATVDQRNSRRVQAKVSYRSGSSSSWRLWKTTDCWLSSTPGSTSKVSVAVPALRHGMYDFMIELFECGGERSMDTRGPDEDRNLRQAKLETAGEDKPPVPKREGRKGRILVGVTGGAQMIRFRQESGELWKGVVALGGAVREVGTLGLEVMAFYSDSVKIFEGGTAVIDMAPEELIAGNAVSLSFKVGVIWLKPKRIGPTAFRGQIDYVAPLAGGGLFFGLAGSDSARKRGRIGFSLQAFYSPEKKYKHPDSSPGGMGTEPLTLGGLGGGLYLQMEF